MAVILELLDSFEHDVSPNNIAVTLGYVAIICSRIYFRRIQSRVVAASSICIYQINLIPGVFQ